MNNRQFENPMSVQTAESTAERPAELSSGDGLESVSVVIPCYNEERFIGKALEQLADQFESDRYEIIVVDGLSDDNTRAVIDEFKRRRPDLTVLLVDNPARNIPTALNLGVAAARGSIIARMDAHAVPSDGYIRRCVEVLRTGTVGAVGMPCLVRPGADTVVARAIAVAVSHPFGIGDAKYRLGAGGPPQEAVDTVAFACFRKSLWKELGGFNETLLTNEDYDFNYRIRQSSRQVILDRAGHCDYFARTTLKALATQYWRYGGWKAEMIRLQPRSIKLRHTVAPAFVLSLIVLAVASLVWTPARWLLLFEAGLYLVAALAAGWHATRETEGRGVGLLLVMPIVFGTIHVTWGISFLVSISTFGRLIGAGF
jgi:succinoglycan biosynthesis protein ExoA